MRVFVTLKRGVLDPAGGAVGRALRSMGYGEVEDVRLGRLVEVTLKDGQSEAEGRARLDEMCRRLLANTVIEEYAFEEAARP